MSIESNNFINELKYDVLKDKIKLFLFRNINKIIILSILILVFIFGSLFITLYKNNKLSNYNEKIYYALNGNNKIQDLEKLYNDNSIPRISKTFAGFSLVDLYSNIENKENILKEIYENEKDLFFKNYAGISILSMEINKNNYNKEYIESLIIELDKKDNPLINLFLEQKALYLVKENKKEEAKKIFINLLLANENEYFKNRINIYLKQLF